MENIEISVYGNRASVISSPMLTSGTVGLPVAFKFDQQWNELSKTAVFKAGNVVKDQVNIENTTIVPHEVLLKPKKNLEIGVYGVSNNGDVVIPTIWVNIGVIQPGADPSGDESADPTLPVWEQVTKDALEYVKQNLTPLDMSGHKIFNVANGVDDWDAATVGQVKKMVKEAGGGSEPVPDYTQYFDIDDNGVVSLKPKYQADGELNSDLPEKIVIPDVIDGTAVSAVADYMFQKNTRVKSITIPKSVLKIPVGFVNEANNLEEVNGTENVEVIGNGAFRKCGIKKALFPNLKSFEGTHNFNYSTDLMIVDIGNYVTEISSSCFSGCERLSLVLGGASVTSVGSNTFSQTRNLLNLPFAGNLKSIGEKGFVCSRVNYDWWNLQGCTFGSGATPAQFNPNDWWSGCTFTACERQLGSTFNQKDTKWATDFLPNSSDTYAEGCLEVSAAQVYSALTGIEFDSPKHFVENIVGGIDNGRLLTPTGTESSGPAYDYRDIVNWHNELGLHSEQLSGGWNKTNLQKVYDALADDENPALVIAYTHPGHIMVIYGVTSNGEMMLLDSDPNQGKRGIYEPTKFKMRVQNLTIQTGAVIITKKWSDNV